MPHAGEELTRALFADIRNLGWSLGPPTWFGATPPQSGLYRMRLQASGIRPPGGQLAHLRIGKKSSSGVIEGGLIELDITAPEDNPEIYEFEVLLEMPTNLYFEVVATEGIFTDRSGGAFKYAIGLRPTYIFTHSSENHLLNPTAPQMFDEDGNAIFPTVIVDWIEWEGPLETAEERSLREGLLPPDDATLEVVADHLQRFAERSWRRPVTREELEGYLAAYESERDAGESVAEAFRVAMKGVLTSRHFIYLVEGEPDGRDRLNDWELASRLAYFLWSSMPDDSLFAAARNGALTGDGLRKEVDHSSYGHLHLPDGSCNFAAMINAMVAVLADPRVWDSDYSAKPVPNQSTNPIAIALPGNAPRLTQDKPLRE